MRFFLIIASFFIIVLTFSCQSDKPKDKYQNITAHTSTHQDGYVGSQNCKNCHEDVYHQWEGSHHQLAMQLATEQTVLGDFNDIKTTIDGVNYHFYKKDSNFYVQIEEIDNSTTEYKIENTFGLTPLQQYMIDFEGGKKQVLRATWDVIAKKWYHQYPGEKINPNDWMHWSNGAQNWNTMCAECHSTNLKKNYQLESDTFKTTFSEISVSCESCHGPGEKHLFWATETSKELDNPYIHKGASQFEQIQLCPPCHARRVKLTENLKPGENFDNQYMVQNINHQFYHKDGQIDDEDYVYGSFLQSKMYAEGVSCNDCHNVHTLELKYEGNNLCMQCHEPTYNTPEHHFHPENSAGASCIECHMTGKNYMGNDFRRDHSFRVPRPDQSVAYGTPNACTTCHKDKSDKWAAEQIETHYGKERASHFSDHLLVSQEENISTSEMSRLNAFINDLNYPEIARSTVIEGMQITNNQQIESLLLALNDISPLIRYNALIKFRNMPLQDRLSIAVKHAQDTSKLVRIGVGQLLYGMETLTLSESEKTALEKPRVELEQMLFSNADFASGRMQLGDHFMQANNVPSAIKHYEMALKKDSLLLPVYSNLATAYSVLGQYDKTNLVLKAWIKKEPESSRPYYLRALLNFELQNNEQAVNDLNKAIEMDPQNSRAIYNLATYYYQNKKFIIAEKNIQKALKVEPQNADFKYLLALIYKEAGKTQLSNKIMQELNANKPE